MRIHLIKNRSAAGWTAFGGYWQRGSVRSEAFELRNSRGESVPLQSEIAARWPDGSVKWSRHTARADQLGGGGTLSPGGGCGTPAGLEMAEDGNGWTLSAQGFSVFVPKAWNLLAAQCRKDRKSAFSAVYPVLRICHETEAQDRILRETVSCPARITTRILETLGPLEAVFRFDGAHLDGGAEKMPFRVRMHVYADGNFSFEHTFFFKGDPQTDRLAGWGLRFETELTGRPYQRQIRFLTDGDVYRDYPTQLFYWRRHLDPAILAAQTKGETVAASPELDEIAEDLPRWDRFCLTQDSARHYAIRKKAWENGCWLEGVSGKRAPGAMTVNDPERSFSLHIRDFWEKYPAGLETEGLSAEKTLCTAWFYAPGAEPYDFRHYDRRTYPDGNYEGFDYMRPDPNGIAVTCLVSVFAESGYCADREIRDRNEAVRRPPVYTADPQYYHDLHAFGYWSLPQTETETGRWTEEQIEAACDFYLKEAEARNWYGLFNYGDVMHTYEACRHMWRWDVGGYAWDNTELTPTYWLWLQFLRTGSELVFRMAEALSRHAADVDMYHFGPMKGLGSRHNVRHWGCPCKEPRISMAGHHRPLYYLTGNRRIGDCMEDSLAAAESLAAMPWYTQGGGVRLRSGPDWSALVSDWMTAYERFLDPKWLRMIENGIGDLMKAPLGLTSGPIFGFDAETGHLEYRGEAARRMSMHLQACMGGPEVWLETAEMLEKPELAELVARNGRYFGLGEEDRMRESGGLLKDRQFGSPIYSADMQAWAARESGDAQTARNIWTGLLALLYSEKHPEGFLKREAYAAGENGEKLWEIPWISTNFTAQWCLKVIVAGELIPGAMPETLEELRNCIRERTDLYGLYGA